MGWTRGVRQAGAHLAGAGSDAHASEYLWRALSWAIARARTQMVLI